MLSKIDILFENELKKSDLLKTRLTIVIISISVALAIINFKLIKRDAEELIYQETITHVCYYLFILFSFEIAHLLLSKRHRKKIKLLNTIVLQYISAFIEISIPAAILLSLSNGYVHPSKSIQLPIVYTYFIFITLSILSLNYKLTLFIGIVASVQYLMVSNYLIHLDNHLDQGNIDTEKLLVFTKTALISLCTIAATFTTIYLKRKIKHSLVAYEKEFRLTKIIKQQLSPDIAEKVIATKNENPFAKGTYSIMFIDIRNFTSKIENKSFEEYTRYQNDFFSIIIESLQPYNATIHQFLGDGCMISFHDTKKGENSSVVSVKAAQTILYKLNEATLQGKLEKTTIGIGIHTGEAVLENLGNNTRKQFSLSGKSVIIAARIEHLNKELKTSFLISEKVYENILEKKSHNFRYLGKFQLKGIMDSMGIYSLET